MRTLTATDAHAVMTLIGRQATGQQNLTVTDTSSFVSVGEKVLATGMENTLNALGIVLGKTMISVRPYKAKFGLTEVSSDLYATRLRKVSFYAKDPVEAGDWNTQLHTNLKDGYDNGNNQGQSTASMWEQHQPIPMELTFGGQSVWQDAITLYEYQVKPAFANEAAFNSFVSGIMTEKANDIETEKEAFARMNTLNFIAGLVDLNLGNVHNLTAEFNAAYGTSYTSAELQTTYADKFYPFFVSQFKLASDRMTNRSKKDHWSPAKSVDGVNYSILRHTPKSNQKAYLYNPLFNTAEAMVFPKIFNDNYLKVENYEGVDYWQAESNPAAINVTPAIPNVAQPGSGQIAGDPVSIPYVVGLLFDEDALMTMNQLEDAATTPVEARKKYRNIWYSFSKNAINDFTENAVLFIMKDPEA